MVDTNFTYTNHVLSARDSIKIMASSSENSEEILTPAAIEFIRLLHQKFNAQRINLLKARSKRQLDLDNGKMPTFLRHTSKIRNSDWTVAPIPDDLQDRRVEITGPADAKMIINALNSGASTFMADLEDSMAPSWGNIIDGQIALRDAVRKTLTFKDPKTNKFYSLNPQTAVLIVRPRGWHLPEKHILYGGKPASGSLVDFGLYFFHNAKYLIENGSGPYFYLPKIESYKEARLWNDVFLFAQDYLGIPKGSIKATVLIETILASFELDEILWELKDHSAGLNCGRWDYIFSFIKKFRQHSEFVLPDRTAVSMTVPFMRAYALRVIQVCHRRACHAIGGMAAQIPIKNDEAANEQAMQKVKQDKLREVTDGHDGTWVAHPGLVPIAKAIFDQYMPTPNQISKKRDDIEIKASDLLQVPSGSPTEQGVRQNINVGIMYVENWLRGNGCVALYNLMEDAATAEISRTQLWQWVHHQTQLEDGRILSDELYNQLKNEELQKIKTLVGESAFNKGKYEAAIILFDKLVKQKDFAEFLTLPAYETFE